MLQLSTITYSQLLVGLRQDAFDALGQVLLAVIDRRDDTHQRLAELRGWFSIIGNRSTRLSRWPYNAPADRFADPHGTGVVRYFKLPSSSPSCQPSLPTASRKSASCRADGETPEQPRPRREISSPRLFDSQVAAVAFVHQNVVRGPQTSLLKRPSCSSGRSVVDDGVSGEHERDAQQLDLHAVVRVLQRPGPAASRRILRLRRGGPVSLRDRSFRPPEDGVDTTIPGDRTPGDDAPIPD